MLQGKTITVGLLIPGRTKSFAALATSLEIWVVTVLKGLETMVVHQ